MAFLSGEEPEPREVVVSVDMDPGEVCTPHVCWKGVKREALGSRELGQVMCTIAHILFVVCAMCRRMDGEAIVGHEMTD